MRGNSWVRGGWVMGNKLCTGPLFCCFFPVSVVCLPVCNIYIYSLSYSQEGRKEGRTAGSWKYEEMKLQRTWGGGLVQGTGSLKDTRHTTLTG